MTFTSTKEAETTSPKYIMLVEDDHSLAQWFSDYLIENGFVVSIVNQGDIAIELIKEDEPDMVILDIMLPVKDGFEVCKSVRDFYHGPILMMTARDQESDEILGLNLGADDYVTKPVRPQVLLSRVKALLRRADISQGASLEPSQLHRYGAFMLDASSRSVCVNDKKVAISSNEFDVLLTLVKCAGEVVHRETLVSELRGIEYDGFDRSIDIMVSRIRKKLGDDAQNPFRIKTVWGKGYLFAIDAW